MLVVGTLWYCSCNLSALLSGGALLTDLQTLSFSWSLLVSRTPLTTAPSSTPCATYYGCVGLRLVCELCVVPPHPPPPLGFLLYTSSFPPASGRVHSILSLPSWCILARGFQPTHSCRVFWAAAHLIIAFDLNCLKDHRRHGRLTRPRSVLLNPDCQYGRSGYWRTTRADI